MLSVARRPWGERRPPPGAVLDLAARRRASSAEVTAWLGMVVFLGSWAMMFAGLFFAYGLVRARAVVWPPLDQPPLPLLLPGLNTAVIAGSSAALLGALRALGGRRRRPGAWLVGLAASLGALFLVLQAVVWARLWQAGLVPSGGPYPSAFYGLTALHALHVLLGVAALARLAFRARGGRKAPLLSLRLWGMYWHFVGVVWLLMYFAVYVV